MLYSILHTASSPITINLFLSMSHWKKDIDIYSEIKVRILRLKSDNKVRWHREVFILLNSHKTPVSPHESCFASYLKVTSADLDEPTDSLQPLWYPTRFSARSHPLFSIHTLLYSYVIYKTLNSSSHSSTRLSCFCTDVSIYWQTFFIMDG